MAEKENQKNQGKGRGRKEKNINERKGEKTIYGGHYLPVCVYIERDLLQRMTNVKKYGWSRREIIEEGIKRMLEEIEKRETEKKEKNEHGIIL